MDEITARSAFGAQVGRDVQGHWHLGVDQCVAQNECVIVAQQLLDVLLGIAEAIRFAFGTGIGGEGFGQGRMLQL